MRSGLVHRARDDCRLATVLIRRKRLLVLEALRYALLPSDVLGRAPSRRWTYWDLLGTVR